MHLPPVKAVEIDEISTNTVSSSTLQNEGFSRVTFWWKLRSSQDLTQWVISAMEGKCWMNEWTTLYADVGVAHTELQLVTCFEERSLSMNKNLLRPVQPLSGSPAAPSTTKRREVIFATRFLPVAPPAPPPPSHVDAITSDPIWVLISQSFREYSWIVQGWEGINTNELDI
jgi:hypothetical protein